MAEPGELFGPTLPSAAAEPDTWRTLQPAIAVPPPFDGLDRVTG